jgi:hypothetical protein
MKTNEISKYMILQSYNPSDLDREVQQSIEGGWEPHGSLVIEAAEGMTTMFFQPMVKYVKMPTTRK